MYTFLVIGLEPNDHLPGPTSASVCKPTMRSRDDVLDEGKVQATMSSTTLAATNTRVLLNAPPLFRHCMSIISVTMHSSSISVKKLVRIDFIVLSELDFHFVDITGSVHRYASFHYAHTSRRRHICFCYCSLSRSHDTSHRNITTRHNIKRHHVCS